MSWLDLVAFVVLVAPELALLGAERGTARVFAALERADAERDFAFDPELLFDRDLLAAGFDPVLLFERDLFDAGFDPALAFDCDLVDAAFDPELAFDRGLLAAGFDCDLVDAAFDPELLFDRDLGFDCELPVGPEPELPELRDPALPLASAARWRADLLALWAAAGVAGGLAFCAASGL